MWTLSPSFRAGIRDSTAWLGTAGQHPDSTATGKGNAGSGPQAQGGSVLPSVSVGTQHMEQGPCGQSRFFAYQIKEQLD